MRLRLTLGHEIGQSKAKYRCLKNIFLRFSSLFSADDGKLDWTLPMKLELRTFLYDICHYDILNKELQGVLIHLTDSIICRSLLLYALLASLKKALGFTVERCSTAESCLTMFDNRILLLLK